jgi:hypothetical protein
MEATRRQALDVAAGFLLDSGLKMSKLKGGQALQRKGRELPREDAFRVWLGSHTDLGERAIGDTVSRAKRAAGLISIEGAANESQVRYLLENTSEYQKCTASVRSQLKKAVLLYRSFRSNR